MSDKTFSFSFDLKFEAEISDLSEQQINSVIPFDFKGKEDFIKFYLTYNGVYFPNGAMLHYYRIPNENCYTAEIESFYRIRSIGDNSEDVSLADIWGYAKKHSQKAKEFAEIHIPFAGDASGNDYWINISTGNIKYVNWEYQFEEERLVASSFKDFCLAIRPLKSPVLPNLQFGSYEYKHF
ncbi:MAG: SMI1/KNR4 family protein [Bacteroidales bacterium]|jgi:hypothetical protein|nr:SMI1/KNR4 family protein [Bacteroidales bacterium]